MPSQYCYGQIVQNDPCYPFCSKPDGSGCDYSPMGNTSSANPFGLTGDPYSVTYSDQGKLTGNFDTRTYVPTIDPYQVQVPKKNFAGFLESRQYLGFYGEGNTQCAFANQTGTAESITQDGKTMDLTAVPRWSTADFFKSGEMNGVIPQRSSSRHSWQCSCGARCVIDGPMTMTTAQVKSQCESAGGQCEQKCPSSRFQQRRR